MIWAAGLQLVLLDMVDRLLTVLATMGWVDRANIALAIIGALAALGACNRMSRLTPACIRLGFVTTGAGLIGFAISNALPAAGQSACDTLLLGGVSALIIGTRQHTVWVRPQLMPWISLSMSAATWLAFFAGVE